MKKYDVIIVGAGPAGLFDCCRMINHTESLHLQQPQNVNGHPKIPEAWFFP